LSWEAALDHTLSQIKAVIEAQVRYEARQSLDRMAGAGGAVGLLGKDGAKHFTQRAKELQRLIGV